MVDTKYVWFVVFSDCVCSDMYAYILKIVCSFKYSYKLSIRVFIHFHFIIIQNKRQKLKVYNDV